MNVRRILAAGVGLCCLVAVAAGVFGALCCTGSGDIKVGGLFALTGEAADWGQDEAEATRLAVDDANRTGGVHGKKVVLVLEDGPNEEVNASVTAFRKLVDVHKVPIVLGPTWDVVAAAVAPIAEDKRVVILASDVSSGVEKEKSFAYSYSLFAPEKSEMVRLVEFLKSRGAKKVATVYNLDPFSQQWRDAFAEAAQEAGLEVSAEFPVSDPEAKDFRTQITRLKTSGVDAVYVDFTAQDTKGPFMRQAGELGLGMLVVSSSPTETQSLLDNYGQYMEGLYIAAPTQTEESKKLLERFEAKYGHPARSPAVPYAYDAAMILVEVLKQGARTGPEIKKALDQLKDYKGVSAPSIAFNERGRAVWSAEAYELKVVRGGVFVKAE